MNTNNHGGPREGAGRTPLPPEERKRRMSFTLAPDVADRLTTLAEKTGRTQTELVEQAVRGYFSPGDPLREVAAQMFGVPAADVTAEQRRAAKAATFPDRYGVRP